VLLALVPPVVSDAEARTVGLDSSRPLPAPGGPAPTSAIVGRPGSRAGALGRPRDGDVSGEV